MKWRTMTLPGGGSIPGSAPELTIQPTATLERHLDGVLRFVQHPITNGVAAVSTSTHADRGRGIVYPVCPIQLPNHPMRQLLNYPITRLPNSTAYALCLAA